MSVTIRQLIEAANQEESRRRVIYKRLRLNHFVSDDYADAQIGEMVHIAAALEHLEAKGVEAIQGDCTRPAGGSQKTDTQDADRSKASRGNAANMQKRVRGA